MSIKPLYLLADSQLLFWKEGDRFFAREIREETGSANPQAAYIGASNGDQPEFYALFQFAMEGIGVSNCRMIPWDLSKEDEMFLTDADIVLLAGGDVQRGWRTIEQNGVKDLLMRKRYDGAVFAGVSAGAVQLGRGDTPETGSEEVLKLFGFAPFYIGAHEEQDDWQHLRRLVELSPEDEIFGIGISRGGGAIYGPDASLAPVRRPLTEFSKKGAQITEKLVLPE